MTNIKACHNWAVKYLDNATRDLNAHETINYLREITHYGAKGRERLNTDILFFGYRMFKDNYQDILMALSDMPYEKVTTAINNDFKEEAVYCVLEIVAGIMADELEEALKN
ncbi:hypothetical protein 015DV004_268 [Bacillus phage 015DV004]|nr:hypothetical protein 015DV004_8 [Bacillus phage 015DV004]QQO41483.1 hypothetical protein 015DV004_268 [Bacillus phage 015DV004]